LAEWEWVALAMGTASVALGIATRLGFRAGSKWYKLDSASGMLKNRPFVAIPRGLDSSWAPSESSSRTTASGVRGSCSSSSAWPCSSSGCGGFCDGHRSG